MVVKHYNNDTTRRARNNEGIMNQRDYKNSSSGYGKEENNDTESSSDSSAMSDSEKAFSQDDRALFEKARNHLNPSPFFRWIICLYGQRKLYIFFFIHFVSTIVIWMHFALIKFEQQADKVPEDAHRYWLKRLIPPIEFGSMHAILFQMALIPITMCRCSISALAESTVNKVIPLNRALAMHIRLGYTMIIIVFFATILFFFFFGLLCSEGEQAFCDKFTMEIMITGYCILGTLLIIGLTSHFRHRIPYEIFYAVHHVVFLMYIITIAHTLDMEQRSGRSQRSQTFKWFSSTLLYYFCDRIAMHMNHRYDVKLISSSVVWGSKGSKLIILKVQRPALFHFKSGQHAYIRVAAINNQWHPFSIASRPGSSHLEFYIEVYDGKAWTKQLWDLFEGESDSGKIDVHNLKIEVMGPYGTSLSQSQKYSHILAIGGGTGVVPILSMYKDHIHNLLRSDPDKFFTELDESEEKLRRIEHAEDAQKGSLMQQIFRVFGGKYSSDVNRRETLSKSIRRSIVDHDELQNKYQIKMKKREIYKSATVATLPIYGTVLLSILPVAGVTLLSLLVSWSTIQVGLYAPMVVFLKHFTVAFHCFFAFVSIFIWNADGILAYVDAVFVIISPFADWYWIKVCSDFQKLFPNDIIMFSILILYMIGRLWVKAVAPIHSRRYSAIKNDRAIYLDQLKFVWLTRSASQVSEILPDILMLWDLLVEKWGLENAQKVCDISIYVTDPNELSCALLRKEYENTDFFRNGGIAFQRPDMMKVIENHTIELINSRANSHSLLAFCGSPSLANEIHYNKISNDVITAMTGHCQSHTMDYVSESYGGKKTASKNEKSVGKESFSLEIDDDDEDCVEVQLLTNRKTLSFYDEDCFDCLSFSDLERDHKSYLFEI